MDKQRKMYRDDPEAESWVSVCIGATACFAVGVVLMVAMAILVSP